MENKRLRSLDAFRGFTIMAMILVNNPGSWEHVYPPLLHSKWNGITPTDLIFPFFLFIVGVSIVLAYENRLERGENKYGLVRKIIFRTLKIFFVGLLLNFIQHFNFSELRIAGVLQRISIVFLVCSLLYLFAGWKARLWIGSVILLLYWLSMTYIPTPGYGRPILEPGVNLAAWVDTKLLPGTMWEGTWDPEGILSTFPAIVTGLLGMVAGGILRRKNNPERKVIELFIFGLAIGIVGYAWSWTFPLNKNLWTSSYVLFTAGLATMLLSSLVYLMDILAIESFGRAGIIFGANAIAIYVLSDLLTYIFYGWGFGSGLGLNQHFMHIGTRLGIVPEFSSFLYALIYIGINFIPAYFLYWKRIFIRL